MTLQVVRRVIGFGRVVRVEQWWTFKLVPPLVAIYGESLRLNVPIVDQWRETLAVLIALASGAAAVSIVNDWFDRADDRAAGKLNRLAGAGPRRLALLLAPHALVAAGANWWWGDRPIVLAIYGATWAAFILYSVPPIRLKKRGFAGAAADAAGANLLPVLLAGTAIAPADLDAPWLAALALWAGMFGLRGIIWHQLGDLEADRLAGVRTFVVAAGQARVRRIVARLLFPMELAGLAALLLLANDWLAIPALIFYASTVRSIKRRYRLTVTLTPGQPGAQPLMHDFYLVFLPTAFLLTSAVRHPLDLLTAALHAVAFAPALLAYGSEVRGWRR